MGRLCIICYGSSKEIPTAHWNGRETLKGFFSLLESYLDPNDPDDEEADKLPSIDKLLSAGMVSCEVCSKVVNSFCELYQQLKSIELKLSSQLRTIKGIMATAERTPARKREFTEGAKRLTIGDEASAKHLIDWVFKYKLELIKKCMWKLETLTPITDIDHEDKTDDNHPSLEADIQSSILQHTKVKSEPMAPESTADFDSETDQTLSTCSDKIGNIQDLQDSDAPSSSEGDSDDDKQDGQDPNKIRLPLVISAESTKDMVAAHSILDPETRKHKCLHCSKQFNDSSHFKRHYNNVHLIVQYKCTLCDKQFTRRVDYNKHLQNAHFKKFKCGKCNKMFTKFELGTHQRLHHNWTSENSQISSTSPITTINPETGRLKCPLCPGEFKDVDASLNHYQEVHDKSDLKCQVCHKVFSANQDLHRHYRTIHLGETFFCPGCPKSFVRKDKLHRHQRDVCGKPKPRPSRRKPKLDVKQVGPKPVCEQCGETFNQISHLKTHLKTIHLQIRDHICDTCGKGFSVPKDLKRHVDSVHLQIREFTCDMCGKAFNRNSQLKVHVKTVHLKSRDHVCDLCEKGFGDASEFRRHLKKVHNQTREYSCELCGEGFPQFKELRNHKKTIHLQFNLNQPNSSSAGLIPIAENCPNAQDRDVEMSGS